MSSEAIENWNPHEPEVMRMCAATRLALGVAADDVYHRMTHDNPALVLSLAEAAV